MAKAVSLGVGKLVTRSNLAKTNEQCDYGIFGDFAYLLGDSIRETTSSTNQISTMSMNYSVLVNQVYLIFNRPHFLVDSSDRSSFIKQQSFRNNLFF